MALAVIGDIDKSIVEQLSKAAVLTGYYKVIDPKIAPGITAKLARQMDQSLPENSGQPGTSKMTRIPAGMDVDFSEV